MVNVMFGSRWAPSVLEWNCTWSPSFSPALAALELGLRLATTDCLVIFGPPKPRS